MLVQRQTQVMRGRRRHGMQHRVGGGLHGEDDEQGDDPLQRRVHEGLQVQRHGIVRVGQFRAEGAHVQADDRNQTEQQAEDGNIDTDFVHLHLWLEGQEANRHVRQHCGEQKGIGQDQEYRALVFAVGRRRAGVEQARIDAVEVGFPHPQVDAGEHLDHDHDRRQCHATDHHGVGPGHGGQAAEHGVEDDHRDHQPGAGGHVDVQPGSAEHADRLDLADQEHHQQDDRHDRRHPLQQPPASAAAVNLGDVLGDGVAAHGQGTLLHVIGEEQHRDHHRRGEEEVAQQLDGAELVSHRRRTHETPAAEAGGDYGTGADEGTQAPAGEEETTLIAVLDLARGDKADPDHDREGDDQQAPVEQFIEVHRSYSVCPAFSLAQRHR
ncbi:hypothetical protein D3C84_601180 [compost metagenome]